MPPKGSGKPKGKRKSAGNSARVQAEVAAALAAAGGGEAASDAGLIRYNLRIVTDIAIVGTRTLATAGA